MYDWAGLNTLFLRNCSACILEFSVNISSVLKISLGKEIVKQVCVKVIFLNTNQFPYNFNVV